MIDKILIYLFKWLNTAWYEQTPGDTINMLATIVISIYLIKFIIKLYSKHFDKKIHKINGMY